MAPTNLALFARLRCPKCLAALVLESVWLHCENCHARYPVVENIPVLIDENRSLFRVDDFTARKTTTLPKSSVRSSRNSLRRRLFGRSLNLAVDKNIEQLLAELRSREAEKRKVLIVGGGIIGAGCQQLLDAPNINIIETDVSFGPRTEVICDLHCLPFEDSSFDCVIVQAVLEHVIDPVRCVEEVHRVLRVNGIVYSEIPFMQQVHMGRYDFQRYSLSGHRLLFRSFDELSAGVCCGPGTAFLWALEYFVIAISPARFATICGRIMRLIFCWLKLADYICRNRSAAIDAASATFFLGRKRNSGRIPEHEIVMRYSGPGVV